MSGEPTPAGSSDADGLILGSFGGQLTIGQFLVGRIQRGLTVFSTSLLRIPGRLPQRVPVAISLTATGTSREALAS